MDDLSLDIKGVVAFDWLFRCWESTFLRSLSIWNSLAEEGTIDGFKKWIFRISKDEQASHGFQQFNLFFPSDGSWKMPRKV